MGVGPREVVESLLLGIFKTWQVPTQHILVALFSWPPKVCVDMQGIRYYVHGAVFWIRRVVGTVYFCTRYQPQYWCVGISSDSTCRRHAVLSLFGHACQHHRTTDCASSATGLWWGWVLSVDNREYGLRKALHWWCHFCSHSVMAGWMKPGDWSGVDEGSLGTRSWVGSVSVKALDMKRQMRTWEGNRMVLEALRIECEAK